MARQIDIETGVDKAASALKGRQQAEMSTQWRSLRNKLDTVLLSTNVMKTNEVRQLCLELDGKTIDERREHIAAYWGRVYLEKSEPILIQLESLENVIAKNDTGST